MDGEENQPDSIIDFSLRRSKDGCFQRVEPARSRVSHRRIISLGRKPLNEFHTPDAVEQLLYQAIEAGEVLKS
jgi:hypothetical protein